MECSPSPDTAQTLPPRPKGAWRLPLALLLAIAVGVLSFTLDPKKERAAVPIYAVMSFIVAAVVWFNTIAGLIITSFKSV